MDKLRVRKYANRKLYLIDESRYTTIAELLAQFDAGLEIVIKLHTTNEDVTRNVLLPYLADRSNLPLYQFRNN